MNVKGHPGPAQNCLRHPGSGTDVPALVPDLKEDGMAMLVAAEEMGFAWQVTDRVACSTVARSSGPPALAVVRHP
jgi:ABC-type polar amino acid transport system ATPase subunit